LEIPEACRALAAAEVVAALKHAGSSNLPIEVKQWFRKHPVARVNLSELAVKAIQRVANASELNELWDESERASEWYEVIEDLEGRLKG
jgi:hypothetical protein